MLPLITVRRMTGIFKIYAGHHCQEKIELFREIKIDKGVVEQYYKGKNQVEFKRLLLK